MYDNENIWHILYNTLPPKIMSTLPDSKFQEFLEFVDYR
jgi:hypothetical protein